QAGGRGIAPRTAQARHVRDAVAGARLHAVGERGNRRTAVRRRAKAARDSRQARLVRGRRTDFATATRAGAAGSVLFSEGTHGEGTDDRYGSAFPSRQRRAAG